MLTLFLLLFHNAFALPYCAGKPACVTSSGGGSNSYCTYDSGTDTVLCYVLQNGTADVLGADDATSADWTVEITDSATTFCCNGLDFGPGSRDGLAQVRIDAHTVTGPVTVEAGSLPYAAWYSQAGGDNTFYGSPQADIVLNLWGTTGTNYYEGGAGDDQIDGGSGTNYFDGGADNDRLGDPGNGCNNVFLGGSGEDTIVGSSNASCATADYVDGEGNADTITGLGGDDTLCGDGDGDTISGGGGDDTLYGGPGNDDVDGGAGSNDNCEDDAGPEPGCEVLFTGLTCPPVPSWP